MKKLLLAFSFLLMGTAHPWAQSNVVFGTVADYGLLPQNKINVTATLVSPNPRTYNNILIRQDPISRTSDATGYFSFTNLLWGKYYADVSGAVGTHYTFYVGTNTVGTVAIASLITNSAALPPNSGTNYYTQAQVDALIASFEALDATLARTNMLWGTNLTVNANARPLAVYWVYSNNVPLYGILNTNYP